MSRYISKNDQIRFMVEEYLAEASLKDKNYLIGLLEGILWKKRLTQEANSQASS